MPPREQRTGLHDREEKLKIAVDALEEISHAKVPTPGTHATEAEYLAILALSQLKAL
jgi:hypothetical protein